MESHHGSTLSALREILLRGIKSSMQTSYARRSPESSAVPHLQKARAGLRHFVEINPTSAEGWRLLSQAEECLLNYNEAIASLERALSLTDQKKNHKDLKRLALLKAARSEWHDLSLSPEQVRALGEFLVGAGVGQAGEGRSLRFTKQWLADNNISNPEQVIHALARRGGYTDFQILYNVVRG
jgi:tetratricopeptide (TPR) repeat protein